MFKTILTEKRKPILDRWLTLIVNTYPADSGRFLKDEHNQFVNPVGSTFSHAIVTLYDAFIGDADTAAITDALDAINRIRAVQDFSAAGAVAYIFFLKTAIREALGEHLKDEMMVGELLEAESRIDSMALLAFDGYTQCREQLHEIKYSDLKRRSALFGSHEPKRSKQ